MRTIDVDSPERARLFQRAVVYETIVPLVTQGRSTMELAKLLAEKLIHMLTLEPSHEFDDYMSSVVKDMMHILQALLGLTGSTSSQAIASVKTVLESRTGVLLLVSQAISMNPAWNEKAGAFLKWQAAWTEHGPGLRDAVASLPKDPSLAAVATALNGLPVWRDVLQAGAVEESTAILIPL